jgi:hypothetical protein
MDRGIPSQVVELKTGGENPRGREIQSIGGYGLITDAEDIATVWPEVQSMVRTLKP